jgi:uncharacterized protein GlcG (DUF336 family)
VEVVVDEGGEVVDVDGSVVGGVAVAGTRLLTP